MSCCTLKKQNKETKKKLTDRQEDISLRYNIQVRKEKKKHRQVGTMLKYLNYMFSKLE